MYLKIRGIANTPLPSTAHGIPAKSAGDRARNCAPEVPGDKAEADFRSLGVDGGDRCLSSGAQGAPRAAAPWKNPEVETRFFSASVRERALHGIRMRPGTTPVARTGGGRPSSPAQQLRNELQAPCSPDGLHPPHAPRTLLRPHKGSPAPEPTSPHAAATSQHTVLPKRVYTRRPRATHRFAHSQRRLAPRTAACPSTLPPAPPRAPPRHRSTTPRPVSP